MIAFLTIGYVAILALLIKIKVLKPTLWWKLSPAVWMLALFIGLFVPMQFWAPSGPVWVMQRSAPIGATVRGLVTEVPVQPNVDLKKGAILFKIDPVPYRAARDQVKAQLELARIRLKETQELIRQNAVSIYELEQYRAQVKQLKASLMNAEYNLSQTVVRAPADGFVTNVALRPGTRVGAAALSQAMIFVENSQRVIAAQIPQGYLRYIKPDLDAEVTFKIFPGKVFSAKVEYVIQANSLGQVKASGNMIGYKQITAMPFAVRIQLEDDDVLEKLPAGAVGSVAIYSAAGKPTHVIRKVMMRMDAYMNFLKP